VQRGEAERSDVRDPSQYSELSVDTTIITESLVPPVIARRNDEIIPPTKPVISNTAERGEAERSDVRNPSQYSEFSVDATTLSLPAKASAPNW
jgi:hypothetical protein